jgi:hypothetical protein
VRKIGHIKLMFGGGVSLAAELDKLWSEVWARGRLDIPGTKVPFFLFTTYFYLI